MNVVDKILTEWAYRCKKGYPDVNNPDDMKVLRELYSEYGIVMEEDTEKKSQRKPIYKNSTIKIGNDTWIVTKDSTDTSVEAKNQSSKKIETLQLIDLAKKGATIINQKNKPEADTKPKTVPTKTTYDQIIAHELGTKGVPPIEGDPGQYKLTQSNGTIDIKNDHDKAIFRKLYKVAPPKAKDELGSAGSKGSGHGEIAVYWLLSQAGNKVEDSRGGSNADLLVNGVGVEVKSFPKGKDMIQLGRVGKYTQQLVRLNTVFGINALLSEFSGEGKKTLPPNAIHATTSDVVEACEHVLDIYKLKPVIQQYNLGFLNTIFTKIEQVLEHAEEAKTAEELAAILLRDLLKAKFVDKPIGSGEAGYMLNVSPQGDIEYTYITKEQLDTIDTQKILKGVSINQGMINYSKGLFT